MPARQHIQISTGALPSSKLHTLAAAHPFTQQLDVVFPAHPALHAALAALDTAYVTAHMPLARALALHDVTLLSAGAAHDDAWCLDARGVLTLHLAPPSYETLGLPGARQPFRGHDAHTVVLPPRARDAADPAARKVRAWDARRVEEGGAPWPVLYCGGDADATARAAAALGHTAQLRPVKAQTRVAPDLRLPAVALRARPPHADTHAVADWEAEMRALFEWVGMAGLGAQRLRANDRADAYVAVYDAPAGAGAGAVAHVRWRGFLGPAFVQRVLDTVVRACAGADAPAFVALTAHACGAAPVGYVPPGNGKDGKAPARVPRAEGEDAWCVVVTGAGAGTTRWCVAESIGPLDARWG